MFVTFNQNNAAGAGGNLFKRQASIALGSTIHSRRGGGRQLRKQRRADQLDGLQRGECGDLCAGAGDLANTDPLLRPPPRITADRRRPMRCASTADHRSHAQRHEWLCRRSRSISAGSRAGQCQLRRWGVRGDDQPRRHHADPHPSRGRGIARRWSARRYPRAGL